MSDERSGQPQPLPGAPRFVTPAVSVRRLAGVLVILVVTSALRLGYRAVTPTTRPVPGGRAPSSSPSAVTPDDRSAASAASPVPVSDSRLRASAVRGLQIAPSDAVDTASIGSAWDDFKAKLLGRAIATSARGKLKEYQVAQFVYYTEERGGRGPRFGTMQELFDGRQGGAMLENKDWQAAVITMNSVPRALNGYLYSEITERQPGMPLDRSQFAGLCAYPEKPSEGVPVFCMLLDMSDHGMNGEQPNMDRSWVGYRADSALVRNAVTRWSDVMRAPFEEIKKLSPAQGLAQAKAIASEAGVTDAQIEAARAAYNANPPAGAPTPRDLEKPRLSQVLGVLQYLRAEQGRFPDDARGLGFLSDPASPLRLDADRLQDQWGHPYRYRRYRVGDSSKGSEEAEVVSDGPDGQYRTADDVRVTSEVNFRDLIANPQNN